MTPTTLTQLAILIAFVVPGFVYQAMRARLAGEVPQNRDLGNKVLRALAASAVLVSSYLIVLGPWLVDVLGGESQARAWLAQHPRRVGTSSLILLFAIPGAAAFVATRRWSVAVWVAGMRGRGPLDGKHPIGRSRVGQAVNRTFAWLNDRSREPGHLRYDPTPTAWDWAVDHAIKGPGFVRILGQDNQWRGGAIGPSSYFTTYPESPAIFVELAWQIDAYGRFLEPQEASRGAWVPCDGALVVEFLAPTGDVSL